MENGESPGDSSSNNGSKSKDDEAEDDDKDNLSKEEKQIFDAKFKELQVYIPVIRKVLTTYEQKRTGCNDVNIERQYHRFRSLHALFSSKKRCKLDTLLKCEEFFKKRFKMKPNELSPSSPVRQPNNKAPKKSHFTKCKGCCKLPSIRYPHAQDCVCCNCAPALTPEGHCCPGAKLAPASERTNSDSVSYDKNELQNFNDSAASGGDPFADPKPGTSNEPLEIIVLEDASSGLTNHEIRAKQIGDEIRNKLYAIERSESVTEKVDQNKNQELFEKCMKLSSGRKDMFLSSLGGIKNRAPKEAQKSKIQNKSGLNKLSISSSNSAKMDSSKARNDVSDRLNKLSVSGSSNASPTPSDGDRSKIRNESSEKLNKLSVSGSSNTSPTRSDSDRNNIRNESSDGRNKLLGSDSSGSLKGGISDGCKPRKEGLSSEKSDGNKPRNEGVSGGKSDGNKHRNEDLSGGNGSKPRNEDSSGGKSDGNKPRNDGNNRPNKLPTPSEIGSTSSHHRKSLDDPVTVGGSQAPSLLNIPDLSKIEIPDCVSEIVKNLNLRMPNSNFSSKPVSHFQDNHSKPDSSSHIQNRDKSDTNRSCSTGASPASSSSLPKVDKTIPFQDKFDVEPLNPFEIGLSVPVETENRLKNAQTLERPVKSAHSGLSSRDPRSSMNPHSSESRVGSAINSSRPGVKPVNQLPIPRHSVNPSNQLSNQSHSDRKHFISDPRRRVSSELQTPQPLNSNIQGYPPVSNPINSWSRESHQSTMPQFAPYSSQPNHSVAPNNLNYHHPAYVTHHSNTSFANNFSSYPAAYQYAKSVRPATQSSSTTPQDNRSHKTKPESSRQESLSPAEDLILNEDMQMSPDSPKQDDVHTPSSSEKESGSVSLRLKLAEGLTTMQKLGKPEERMRKDRMLSALKPGVVSDLAASSETKNSLFVNSLLSVPSCDRKETAAKLSTPVKYPMVPEKNIDTVNSLKTNVRKVLLKTPITPMGSHPPRPTPLLGRIDRDKTTRFPESSTNQRVPQRSSVGSSDAFNQSIRTCFSANNNDTNVRADSCNETFRSSFHLPPEPTSFNRAFPIHDRHSDLKNVNNSTYKSADPPHRSHPSADQSDIRSHTSSRWSKDIHSTPEPGRRYEDYFPSARSSESGRGRPHASDPRYHRSDSTSSIRNRDPRNESSSAGHVRDPRRLSSHEIESLHNRSRSRPSERITKSSNNDSTRSHSNTIKKLPEPDEREEFLSPLDNDARKSQTSVTGRGYGIQNYKIPKKARPQQSTSVTTANYQRDKDRGMEEKRLVSKKPNSNVEQTVPSAAKDNDLDLESNENLICNDEINDSLTSSEPMDTESDASKRLPKPEKTIASQSQKSEKTNSKLSVKPISMKDSTPTVNKSDDSKKPQKVATNLKDASQMKKLTEDCRITMSDILNKTARVVISSDEESLARSEHKVKTGVSLKPSKNTDIPKTILIESSADDECDLSVKTEKGPAKKSKTKEIIKEKAKSTASVDSDSDSPIKKSSLGKQSASKENKAMKQKSGLSSSESGSESSESSRIENSKVTNNTSSTTKRSGLGKSKLQKKKSVRSSSESSSDCDIPVSKNKGTKKIKDASKHLESVGVITDGSTAEDDTDTSIKREKKSKNRKKSESKQSGISSGSDSSSTSVGSSNKPKMSKKTKLQANESSSLDKKNSDKFSKISESKISSSKKLDSSNNESSNEIAVKNTSKTKKKAKLNQTIVMDTSNDSSDDEVLAVKVQKIKGTGSSENIAEKSCSERKKSAASKEVVSEKDKKHKKNALEEISVPSNVDKADQISCNKVDSTSDTNDTGAEKVPVEDTVKNPSENLLSQLLDQLCNSTDINTLLFTMMIKNMQEKHGNKVFNNIEVMKKLMEGNTLAKIQKILEDEDEKASSPTNSKETVPETSKEAINQIKSSETTSKVQAEEKNVSESLACDDVNSLPSGAIKNEVPLEISSVSASQNNVKPEESISAKIELSSTQVESVISEKDLEEIKEESTSEDQKEETEIDHERQLEKAEDELEQPKKKRRRGKKLSAKKNSVQNLQNWKRRSHDLAQDEINLLSIEERNEIYKEMCVGVAKEFEMSNKTTKKKGKNELDKLHEDIRESYIADDVVNATGIRACRVKTYDMDRSASPDDSNEKIPVSRPVRKKSIDKWEKSEKVVKVKAARLCKRKLSAQYIDSSDSEDKTPKKCKRDSTDCQPPVLEAYTDFKASKLIGAKKRPNISGEKKSQEEVPLVINPPLEIVPVVNPFYLELPEIYALDYFTPKFRRKKFDLSEFERKYVLTDSKNSVLKRNHVNTNAEMRHFGCGRRPDRKRKISPRIVPSVKLSDLSEPKKFKTIQNKSDPLKKIADDNIIDTPVPKETKSVMTRMNKVCKEGKKVLSLTLSKNASKESKKKSKTVEEVKTTIKIKRTAHIKEPGIDDFILVVDKKSKDFTTSETKTIHHNLEEAAKNFTVKSEVDWVDPDYYYKPGVSMDCKLCTYSGRHISDHYMLYHSEDQVLSSRLHYEEGESAIAESLFLDYSDIPDEFLIRFPLGKEGNGTVINKECLDKLLLNKWLKDHSRDLSGIFQLLIDNCWWKNGDPKMLSTLRAFKLNLPTDFLEFLYRVYQSKMGTNLFFCRMCSDVYDNPRKFFEHISLHTGEFLYECTPCQLILPSVDDFVSHQDTTPGHHFLTNRYPLPPNSSILFGYICSACNYVQLVYENLKHHLLMHCDEAKPQIVRINMSKSAPSLYSESCEEAVAKKWHDYKKESVTSCGCPKVYSSSDDLICLAKHFEDMIFVENNESIHDRSKLLVNPFTNSLSTKAVKPNASNVNKKSVIVSSTQSFCYKRSQNPHFISCSSNFSEVLVKMANESDGSFLFCKSLGVDTDYLNEDSSIESAMDEDGLSIEHNYALTKSGRGGTLKSTSETQKKVARNNSSRSRHKFLEDLHERLNTKGGKNYLTELEKKLKLTVKVSKLKLAVGASKLKSALEAPKLKPTVEVPKLKPAVEVLKLKPAVEVPVLDLTEESPELESSAKCVRQARSSESEAPTIHIPETLEYPLPNIMNVIDFSLQMTTNPLPNISNKPRSSFISLASLLPADSKKDAVIKPSKTLPNLISMKKPVKVQKYQMKDPVVRSLKVGPIGAMKLVDDVVFKCFAPTSNAKSCDYQTATINQLISHFHLHHSTTKWNGMCMPCSGLLLAKGLQEYPIGLACAHLVEEHLSAVESAKNTTDLVNNGHLTNLSTTVSKASTEVMETEPSVATPPQPRLRVRPLSDLIDKSLLSQPLINVPEPETENDGNIQIANVVSLSALGDSSLDFASSETSDSVSQDDCQAVLQETPEVDFPTQRLDRTDKLLYMSATGPKRMLSITRMDPESDAGASTSNPERRTCYRFRIQSGPNKIDELSREQCTNLANQDPRTLGGLLLYCRLCSVYHFVNLELFKLECPQVPRVLTLASKSLNFTVLSSDLHVQRTVKHIVFPMLFAQNQTKHAHCYEKMLTSTSLMKLFKCLGGLCSYTSDDGDCFIRHISNHENYVRAITRKSGRKDAAFKKLMKMKDWNTCSYCGYISEGAIDLKGHIEDEHGRSPYQCGYCFYRAFTLFHVAWHQEYAHDGCEPKILACTPVAGTSSYAPAFDHLKPFVCAIGSCTFSTYARKSFKDHLSSEHINCNVLACHMCGVQYFNIDKLLMHYKLHNFCQYQCLFCVYGAETTEEMKLHLLNHHFSRPASVINRSLPNQTQKEAQKNNKWLVKYHLEDQIIVQFLKEIQGGVRATRPPISEDAANEDENITIDEAIYMKFLISMSQKAAQGSKANDKTGNSDRNGEAEEFDVVAGAQNNILHEALSSALSSSSELEQPPTEIPAPNTLSHEAVANRIIVIMSSQKQKEIEEKRKLHKSTCDKRLKKLESAFSLESVPRFLPAKNIGLEDMEEDASESLDFLPYVKHIQSPSDAKKDTEDFELTEDSINSLSLNFEDNIDLSTLCEQFDSREDMPSGSLLDKNITNDSAYSNPNEPRSVLPSHATDNVEDSGLSGFDLYRCGNEGCSYAAETSNNLKDHVLMCDLSRSSTSLTCVHCKKFFKLASSLVEHLRTHGTQRFFCSLCSMRASVPHRIMSHMKSAHRITSTRLHPINPLQTNIDSSVFIVVPRDKQLIGVNKVNPKTGCKISFSPKEINDIPSQKIYSEPMWCAICPYKSMVRVNLLNHLRTHAIGIEPLISDYFNPMPTSESKELEPLTNHALSARMAEERALKEDGAPVLTEHILEDLHSNYLTEFVPLNGRYKCCHVGLCSYITVDASMLCNHLKSLHSDTKTYLCPHCPPALVQPVKLDKLRSHLKFHDDTLHKCSYCEFYHYKKYIVDRHVVLEHPSLAQKTELIRGSDSDDGKHESESPQSNQDSQRSALKPWHCGLCRYRTLNKTDIAVHCFSVHGVYNQYKCVLCPFSNNSLYDFDAHYFEKHQGISKQILCVFDEVTSVPGDNDPVNDVLASRDICHYIPEKFRLKNGLAEERVSLSTEDYIKLKGRYRMLAELGIDDKNGLHGPLGEPDSNGNFVCPRCREYRTANVDDMKCHMYRELNYKLFKCGHCNLASSQFHDLAIHSEEHMRLGDEPCVQQLEPNPDYDTWIDKMIATQKSMMKSKKEGQTKEDVPLVENKFWRFGICSRECMPSYQRFCPNVPIRRSLEDNTKKTDLKAYRCPAVSEDSEIDNFIDIIVSDSDDDCLYTLAPESIPPPKQSISHKLTPFNSKIENYRKSKQMPKMDLMPPQFKVIDESDLQLLDADESTDEEVIVDSDGESPNPFGEGSSACSALMDENSSAADSRNICVDCGKSFTNVISLKNHIRLIHLQLKKYSCIHCKENFSTIYFMKTHLTKCHGDTSERNFTTTESPITPKFWLERYNIQPDDTSRCKAKKVIPELYDDLKYSCVYCVYKSSDLFSMYVHWKQRHKDPVILSNSKIKASTSVPWKYRAIDAQSFPEEGKLVYECVHCQSKGCAEELIAHYVKFHPLADFQTVCVGRTKYECVVCHLHFNSVDSMKRHFTLDHPGTTIQYSIVAAPTAYSNRYDGERSKVFQNFLECNNITGKFVFYGCSICSYFADDSKKMHHHLRKHIEVIVCSGCKRRYPNVDEAKAHLYNCFSRKKILKKCRLSKESWEKLKFAVKVFERPITETLLNTKYLPAKMSSRKRKHRSKGIPQKSDAKRIKLTHCAKKSTAAVTTMTPTPSTSSSSVVKVNQTARKSTDPKTKNRAPAIPTSWYGKKPEPVDLSSTYISMNFGGSDVLRPVSLLSSVMNVNLDPVVKIKDFRKHYK